MLGTKVVVTRWRKRPNCSFVERLSTLHHRCTSCPSPLPRLNLNFRPEFLICYILRNKQFIDDNNKTFFFEWSKPTLHGLEPLNSQCKAWAFYCRQLLLSFSPSDNVSKPSNRLHLVLQPDGTSSNRTLCSNLSQMICFVRKPKTGEGLGNDDLRKENQDD